MLSGASACLLLGAWHLACDMRKPHAHCRTAAARGRRLPAAKARRSPLALTAADAQHAAARQLTLAVDAHWVHRALHRLDHQRARDRPDDEHAHERAQDLGAVVAKGVELRAGLRRGPCGEDGDEERAHVGEHVRRVRHDRDTEGRGGVIGWVGVQR